MNKLLFYQIIIFSTLYFGYGFYYFTRKSMSYMFPYMSDTLNITKNDIGITISSQNLAYAISKFIGGILSDVISCRILFGSGLFLSGILNLSLNKNLKINSLYSISFLLGFVQGPSWPCAAKILQNWIPKAKYGTAWSVLSTSMNIAGAIGPYLATIFALSFHWSYGFMIPGVVSMTFGFMSILLLRNKPSDVKMSDYGGGNQINNDENEDGEKFNRWQQTLSMFKYPYFISLCICYFTVTLVKTIFSDWTQLYLIKALKIDNYTASNFITSFEIAGLFSSIFSGLTTDYIISKKKSKKQDKSNSRMPVLLFYTLLLLISMHLFVYYIDSSSSSLLINLIGLLAGFSNQGPCILIGVMAMEFAPKSLSGTSHAIVALAANFGAICAGLPFSLLSKYYSWKFSFAIMQYIILASLVFLFKFRNYDSKFEIEDKTKKTKVQ